MSVPDYLARVRERVDLTRVGELRVVIFGLGTVGSPIAVELAGSGVRRFRFIDGDVLEAENIVRHAAKKAYVGRNKAEAIAELLTTSYPLESTDIQYYPCFVDGAMADNFLDELIVDADLVVAATDDRRAQRRIAERALAADVPAIFPALYPGGGGEVFVSLGPNSPCLLCWEGFRPADESLRAVTALNVEISSVVALAVQLALGVLDPTSEFARMFAGTSSDRGPRTLFVLRPHASLQYVQVHRRENCPMCGVGRTGEPIARPKSAEQMLDDAMGTLTQRPVVGAAALAAFVLFLVALGTGSAVAVILLTTALTISVLLFYRPRFERVARVVQASSGFAAAGVVNLILLVIALASGSGVMIFLFAVAYSGSLVSLFRRTARLG